MSQLNVSSVKAPSEIHSMVASPEMTHQKVLESRVFGYSGQRKHQSRDYLDLTKE